MGDGSAGRYNVGTPHVKSSWALNNKDLALLEEYKEILNEHYSGQMSFKILNTIKSSGVYKLVPKASRYGDISRIVIEYRKLFYDERKQKVVPADILNSNYETRRAFFRGLYDADGSKTERTLRIDQKGKIGCLGIYTICRSLGYKVSLIERGAGKPNLFRLNISTSKIAFRKKPFAVKSIRELAYSDDYVYDLTTENHHFHAGVGQMIVHNTDSVFCELTALSLREAARMSLKMSDYFNGILKSPHNLEFEKIYWPFLLYRKKMYSGIKYEGSTKPGEDYLCGFDDGRGLLKSKGLAVVRRDNVQFIKGVMGNILKLILEDRSPDKAKEYLVETRQMIVRSLLSVHEETRDPDLLELKMFEESGSIASGRSLDDYADVAPAAAEVARRIRAINPDDATIEPGARVNYFTVADSTITHKSKRARTLDEVVRHKLPLDLNHYMDQFDKKVAPLIAPVMAEEERRKSQNRTLAACWGAPGRPAVSHVLPKRKSDQKKIEGQLTAERLIQDAKVGGKRAATELEERPPAMKRRTIVARRMVESFRIELIDSDGGATSVWARGCIGEVPWPKSDWRDDTGRRVSGKRIRWETEDSPRELASFEEKLGASGWKFSRLD